MRSRLPLRLLVVALATTSATLGHGGRYFGPTPPAPVPAPSGGPPIGGNPNTSPGVNPMPPPSVTGGLSPTGPFSGGWQSWWELNHEWVLSPREATPVRETNEPTSSEQPGGRIPARSLVRERIFPVLVAHAGHSNQEVRSAALVALGKTGLPEAEPFLRRGLEDSARDVREGALLGLGLLRTPSAEKTLLERFDDRRSMIRERAITAGALGMLGTRGALDALLDAVDPDRRGPDRSRSERACALLGLAAAASPQVLPRLVPWVESKALGDGILGALACSALGRIGDRSALPALLRALEDGDPRVRAASTFALARILRPEDDAGLKALLQVAQKDVELEVRGFAWLALGRIGSESVQDALRTALRVVDTMHERAYLYLALGFGGTAESDGPRLAAEVVKGADVNLRSAAAIGLGILRAESQSAALARELASTKNRDFSNALIVALGMLREEGVRQGLSRRVERDRAPEILRAAIVALSLLDDAELIPRVAKRLEHERSSVLRAAGAQGLGSAMDVRHLEIVLDLLERGKPVDELRTVLIVALGRLAEPGSLPLFSALRRDVWYLADDPNVQELLAIL